MLNNPLFTGKVHYSGELYEGEHEAIVEDEIFDRVQHMLRDGGPSLSRVGRNPDFILAGLLTCGYCGAPFTSSSGTGKKGKQYRYYKCGRKVRDGKNACPSIGVSAQKIEGFVAEKIAEVAKNQAIRDSIGRRLEHDRGQGMEHLADQRQRLATRIRELEAEAKSIVVAIGTVKGAGSSLLTARLEEIEIELERAGRIAREIDEQTAALHSRLADTEKMLGILDVFDTVWDALIPAERRELVAMLVKNITLNQQFETIYIDYHDFGDEPEEHQQAPDSGEAHS